MKFQTTAPEVARPAVLPGSTLAWLLASLLACLFPGPLMAQDSAVHGAVQNGAEDGAEDGVEEAQEAQAPPETTALLDPLPEPPVPVEVPQWPGVDALALALADKSTRQDTLLTLAALMTLDDLPRMNSAEQAQLRARELLGNREWLLDLERRFGFAQPRSPVLDPAAWQVQVQLDRVGLSNSLLASPLGPGRDVLARRVLNRDEPSLSAAALPELLWYLEAEAPLVWEGLVRRLGENPWLSVALYTQGESLFDWPDGVLVTETADTEGQAGNTSLDPYREALAALANNAVAGNAAAGDAEDPRESLLSAAMASLEVMLELATGAGPPDAQRLSALRLALLRAMPEFDLGQRAQAGALLHLAGLVDGLAYRNYFHFTESLLAIAARLQDEVAWHPARMQPFSAWLAGAFPGLSAAYGRQFSVVDPELNSVIATAYDVVQTLGGETTPDQRAGLRLQLGDAVAKLALLIPDLGFYFDQPIRDPVAGGVDACTGLAGQFEVDGSSSMTRDLFDDCQDTLVALADVQAREAQLAGNANGPFGPSQLRRELSLTGAQRINYAIGYLHERYQTGCELPGQPLPNPLEWAYLATFMAWFAEQSPVYFQTPENEARLARMQGIGEELVSVLSDQVDCFAGAGAVVNDPVERIAADYQAELRETGRGLESAREAFRAGILKPGADVRLEGGADQSTAYRPSEMTIGPCDMGRACEMTGPLSSTRALSGLFEDVFLVADQTGLGELEICYDNMGWVDRRLEPVRPGDENVANYFGHLAFELRGRFHSGDDTQDLFAFRFKSQDESHYLFSAASEEILEDSCPAEWVGTRIVTGLPEGGFRIVPDRLTYLSAARTLPSRLLESNWDQGAEWRDWFVTGLGVERLTLPPAEDIEGALNQRLEALYRQERATLYGVLATGAAGPNLAAELDDLTTSKLLLRTQMMLFFPHILIHSDPLREAITGQQGLLDRRLVLRARQQELPIDELLATGYERVESFREAWAQVPEAVRRRGSVPDSVAHGLLRLQAINEAFFASPVELQSPVQSSAPSLVGTAGEPASPPLAGTESQADEVQGTEQ